MNSFEVINKFIVVFLFHKVLSITSMHRIIITKSTMRIIGKRQFRMLVFKHCNVAPSPDLTIVHLKLH